MKVTFLMPARNSKAFEFRLGKLGLVLFTIGIALMVSGAFIGGVMVGKNIESYPQKIAKEIPDAVAKKIIETSADMLARARTSEKDTSPQESDDIRLTFYETLPRSEEKEEPKAEEKLPQGAPPVAVEKPQEKVTTAAPVEQASAPVVKEPVKTASGPYSVQVASFKDTVRVERMKERLASLGYTPRVEQVELGAKGTWYRLILEGYGTFQEAEAVSETIEVRIRGINCLVRKTGG
ncbi:MAG: SPOR domain-containing protein [Deltaproteobacteria bacterium]|nr:SPOR domain-containing protein [Deltaproteobacteria bacterium]